MAFDYINEAFKKLDLLNEEMFNSSTDGINHLTDYMRDEEASEDTIRVIDPNATDEEELQDSYIGKLIVNCNVCRSHVFMNKEDVEIDEEGYATSDGCCPYCGEQEGFVIVGEIAPANVKDASSEESETEQDTLDNDSEDEEFNESLTEDFKEVSIKTDDQHLAMTSDENGKVTVVTEPLNSSSQEELDAEMFEDSAISDETIVPVSDETTNEIVDNETALEDEVEGSFEDELSLSDADAPSDTEEESHETEETLEDEDTTDEVVEESLDSTKSDIYFESVDEDQLNSLTESYLKNVYENVSSFKTTNVGADDSHLVVEGVITFASGKQRNTKFIFESKDINHKGQLRFSGHNKSLSESKDCYSLVGTLDNSKLFLESLKYDYTTQDTRVRGVVRRK